MKFIKCLFFSIWFSFSAFAQDELTLFFLGDAGNWDNMPKLFQTLKSDMDNTPNSAFIVLGDNIYPKGMLKKSKDYENEKKKLQLQLDICKDYKGFVFFVPGNHDWRAGRRTGYKSILEQQDYVNDFLLYETNICNKRNNFLPKDGLPGPDFIDINYNFRLIFIDTQWWLQHQNLKKVPLFKNKSFAQSSKIALSKLDSLMQDAKKKNMNVILSTHHPVKNINVRSSNQLILFLLRYTPLKVFGLTGIDRFMVQGSNHHKQKTLFKKINAITNDYPTLVYASGHEHVTYIKNENNKTYLISGTGSKLNHSSKTPVASDFFNNTKPAYVKMKIDKNGNKKIQVIDENNNRLYEQ